MTPHEMLAVLDDAIAETRRPRTIALELTVPEILGQRGKRIRDERRGGAFRSYGYTRLQCEAIRSVILAAARADLDSAQEAVTGD